MVRVIIDFLFLTLGMGAGIVLMCLLQVGKEADKEMEHMKEREEK